MTVNANATILVGCKNRVIWVRVIGKGTFLCSSHLKDFTREMINRGYREFVIDLAECQVMDSTFMGTLAGVALRLRDVGQGQLSVIHLNERNRDLLEGLGLDQLFALEINGITPPDADDLATPAPPDTVRAETSRTMLEAHEALVEADPCNLSKFKDVLEFLRQDLNESQTESRTE